MSTYPGAKFVTSAAEARQLAPDGGRVGHTPYGEEALLVADLDPRAATGSFAQRYAPDRYRES